MNKFLKFCATGALISYVPTAILKNQKNTGAGFLGTLEAVLLYVFLMPRNYFAYFIVLVLFTVFAVYVSDRVDFGDGKKDNPKIVIDEIAGYFFAMAFLPATGIVILCAFVLFRIFDTLKISFIRKAESFGEGLNEAAQKKYFTRGGAVVLDDVVAGIAANLILQAAVIFKLL